MRSINFDKGFAAGATSISAESKRRLWKDLKVLRTTKINGNDFHILDEHFRLDFANISFESQHFLTTDYDRLLHYYFKFIWKLAVPSYNNYNYDESYKCRLFDFFESKYIVNVMAVICGELANIIRNIRDGAVLSDIDKRLYNLFLPKVGNIIL